jgi:hypothetical protein
MSDETTSISLSKGEIKLIHDWVQSFPKEYGENPIISIKIHQTGIGPSMKGYFETNEGEGIWKDLSDYDHW